MTTPLCRFCVPSGSKEKGGRFGFEAVNCRCREWSIRDDAGGADSDAGGQILSSRPSGETERPSLDLSVAGDLAEAVDFKREEKSNCSLSTGGRKRKMASIILLTYLYLRERERGTCYLPTIYRK